MKNFPKHLLLVLIACASALSSIAQQTTDEVLPKRNAMKVALFSMAIGKLDVGYERLIDKGVSLELRGGYSFENDVLLNPATGGFTKAGVKFILPFSSKETPYNRLAGLYLRPELSVGAVSMKYGCFSPEDHVYHRTNRWSMAVLLSGGMQAVIREHFLIDVYAGVGSGSSFKLKDVPGFPTDEDCVNRNWQRYLGHSLASNSFPIALTSGVSFGFVF